MMTTRRCLALCAALLPLAACASIPLAPAPTASPAPAEVQPATLAPTPTLTSAPVPAPTLAQGPSGWQTYSNAPAGFQISYPPDWTLTPTQSDPSQPMQEAMLEGPEGSFQMQWGTGFAGTCSGLSQRSGKTATRRCRG